MVLEGLGWTVDQLGRRDKSEPHRHVSGHELLEGLKDYALEYFGPLARTVLKLWGVRRSEDFGAIVFHLVEAQLLSRQESDSLDDFARGFDFRDALESGYRVRLPSRLGGAP
ncbi:MAG: hypothetical protein IPN34_06720 [Planctomycetes bacterium]|nr:hypothetical protein [Planctomycetota bacterium]